MLAAIQYCFVAADFVIADSNHAVSLGCHLVDSVLASEAFSVSLVCINSDFACATAVLCACRTSSMTCKPNNACRSLSRPLAVFEHRRMLSIVQILHNVVLKLFLQHAMIGDDDYQADFLHH